jgi:hypothetical protein
MLVEGSGQRRTPTSSIEPQMDGQSAGLFPLGRLKLAVPVHAPTAADCQWVLQPDFMHSGSSLLAMLTGEDAVSVHTFFRP